MSGRPCGDVQYLENPIFQLRSARMNYYYSNYAQQ